MWGKKGKIIAGVIVLVIVLVVLIILVLAKPAWFGIEGWCGVCDKCLMGEDMTASIGADDLGDIEKSRAGLPAVKAN